MLITIPKKQFGLHIATDMMDLMIGDLLGRGSYRDVYELIIDKRYVLKIANHDSGMHHNVLEFQFWSNLDEELRQHFAPIHWISAGGNILIQSRVDPVPTQTPLELMLPDVWDIKRENLGMLNGKPVIIDLGLTQFKDFKMKKVQFKAGDNWPDRRYRAPRKRNKEKVNEVPVAKNTETTPKV